VTLCIRLPEWVVLDYRTEFDFKQALQRAMISAVEAVTDSEASQVNRAQGTEAALKVR
jgi:hypothetical protein